MAGATVGGKNTSCVLHEDQGSAKEQRRRKLAGNEWQKYVDVQEWFGQKVKPASMAGLRARKVRKLSTRRVAKNQASGRGPYSRVCSLTMRRGVK